MAKQEKAKKNTPDTVAVPVESQILKDSTVQSAAHVEKPSTAPSPKVDGLASPATAATSTRSSQAEPAKDKILVVLDDNGGIDFGSMREKTKDRFISALRRSEGNIFPKAAEAASLSIPDEAITAIYNMVGVAETMLASSRFPPAIAAQAFMWTKPQIDAVRNPTKAVLAKHAKMLRGFEEETTLALVLVGVHFEKMNTLKMLMAEHTAAIVAANELRRSPGPKPDAAANAVKMPGSVSPSDSPVPEVQ